MKILTSNQYKRARFNLYGIDTAEGVDVAEVQGTSLEVILYKAINAPRGFIVEDSILEVDGEEVVDIKFQGLDQYIGKKAKWIVSLGYVSNNRVYVTRGELEGVICEPQGNGYFFEPYFQPYKGTSVADLLEAGFFELLCPRKKAVDALKEKRFFCAKYLKEVPEWTGKYQNES